MAHIAPGNLASHATRREDEITLQRRPLRGVDYFQGTCDHRFSSVPTVALRTTVPSNDITMHWWHRHGNDALAALQHAAAELKADGDVVLVLAFYIRHDAAHCLNPSLAPLAPAPSHPT